MSQNFDEVTAGSPVAQFYENRVIFITGSTGFMGKVLVEKLLRSTSVKKIYLLIRQKKGVATQARLQDLLSSKLFDSVRTTRAGELSKLVAVHGDITQPRLGLSTYTSRLLVENVSVVFHSAATVKFDEDLTKSVAMNVESVQSMISLCKKMKKLEALVHVSTAYCNCDRSEIKEEVYPPPGNPQGFIQLCKCMDEETLNSPEMTAKLIGNRPNTYTFTKVIDLIPTAPPLPR
ncbi:putative fatty acyl-CoA reductase CG5065 isoform X2 [Eurytemora carolleeae]|uniref:putative fatty acyl-CoA reductase CG5065 isoform X2 n=1 Tax=Eurytemora carolleeae TaxID=1294199 RepID=UPI000C77C877|nr:putative fatty acyl-CoA reductase CG5065 isoform X2 [Eurytemora carolleeae]|eukprot:XP_023328797.1 putative fatty acyl-CoA reductase CG5065 isoform X2 [Eurytemora affinis]